MNKEINEMYGWERINSYFHQMSPVISSWTLRLQVTQGDGFVIWKSDKTKKIKYNNIIMTDILGNSIIAHPSIPILCYQLLKYLDDYRMLHYF